MPSWSIVWMTALAGLACGVLADTPAEAFVAGGCMALALRIASEMGDEKP